MTSESSVASIRSGTTITGQRPEPSRQQTVPSVPSPWTGMPPRQNSMPRMPNSAPAAQINYGMMGMPVVPDPLAMAMFEQGLLRPWAMDSMSNGGSTGTLTPPRLPFGFGSSGDSSGSLTPPRFPNSRPPSWGSSSEDVRMTMQRLGSVGSLGSGGPRPMSGAYSSGGSAEAAGQEWRNSKSSMLVGSADDRSRSQSRSPIDPPSTANPRSLGQNRMKSNMTRSMRSETGIASQQQPQQQQSQHRSRPSASSTSRLRPQEASQTRSRTHPPLPTSGSGGSVKGAYGLPTIESQGSMGSLGRTTSTLSTSKSIETLKKSSAAGTGGQERPRMHGHSKSSGAPASQRKNRLFG